MNKILLYIKIRKFYKLFAEEVGANFITKLSDMTTDNVMSVTFDINEILETYEGLEVVPMYSWLIKLERRCQRC
jgi:hypothetical protein